MKRYYERSLTENQKYCMVGDKEISIYQMVQVRYTPTIECIYTLDAVAKFMQYQGITIKHWNMVRYDRSLISEYYILHNVLGVNGNQFSMKVLT